jgi:hypothetical protein
MILSGHPLFFRHMPGLLGAVVAIFGSAFAAGQDNSPAPILQWFDGTYQTQAARSSDLFMAGYGAVWLPPPGRASGGVSVGYDVFDRFDLGSWNRKTLYGTEQGFLRVGELIHRQGAQLHIDSVVNHNAFSDSSTAGFQEAGGYPGFVLQNPDYDTDPNGDVTDDPFGIPNTDGDFHTRFDGSVTGERLAGLIDIDQATNWRFIRQPTTEGDPLNIPAGTVHNRPDPTNARFYPDLQGEKIVVFDPLTGEGGIEIHRFNRDDPMAGDAVAENALGYLMRYEQYMVEVMGVDGFRIDAMKHVDGFALGYLDRAVYRANPRLNLDGSVNHVFSYGEVFEGSRDILLGGADGNRATLNDNFFRKDINDADPGRVGGNRDVLDFAQAFALEENLKTFLNDWQQNDWRNVVNAGLDVYDDGFKNGSAGVMFVRSHDEFGTAFEADNVAHAYMLTHPGNSVVYFNGKEHGDNRDFPKDGRGDALGGVFGDTVTELVEIRNTHGRGNYFERHIDQHNLAYEREGSMLVLLNNRNDNGVDGAGGDPNTPFRLNVNLPFGTHLVELTGNHVHDGLIPELLTVTDDGPGTQTYVNARFLRNQQQGHGYLIYGLATPQSNDGIELTNVTQILEGGTPQPTSFSNGTTRLTDLHVIEADTFTLSLETNAVNLLGSIRDRNADGDNALFKIDGGIDANGNGVVDFVTPGSVAYGFEEFLTTKQAGFFEADGNGFYEQVIDTTGLAEGEHYLTARVFRHRDDSGVPVYADFKKVIYVDRLAPEAGLFEVLPVNAADSGDFDLVFESLDHTANAMHVFLNEGAAVDDQTLIDRALNGENATDRVDASLYKTFFGGMIEGNHTFSVVTFEPTGTTNVQRFYGFNVDNGPGAGLGDLNGNGQFQTDDLSFSSFGFEAVLYSQDTVFNPAADIDGDGRVGWTDLLGLRVALIDGGASQAVLDEYDNVLRRRGDVNANGATDSFDIDEIVDDFGTDDWRADLDSSGTVDSLDRALLVSIVFATAFGDADLDQQVDLDDLTRLGEHYGQAGGWAQGDFTGDGRVNLSDLALLGTNFGFGSSSTMTFDEALAEANLTHLVPEPSSLALVVIAGTALLRRRR